MRVGRPKERERPRPYHTAWYSADAAGSTEINLPFITADASGPKHLNMKLSRAKLEELVDTLIQRTVDPCKNCLRDAGTPPAPQGASQATAAYMGAMMGLALAVPADAI